MNQSELDLIASIRPDHDELARLLAAHEDYESRLAALAGQKWRSAEEYAEEQRLKREKLAGRDRIQRILAEHRISA
jgi:uncharacterized protein YdcH (DUF465 family)